MSSEHEHAREKLWGAIQLLIQHSEPIQKRLQGAYFFDLRHLDAEDFPVELRDDFREIVEAVSWIPAEDGEAMPGYTTTRRMSEDEASRTANRILWLLRRLVDEYD